MTKTLSKKLLVEGLEDLRVIPYLMENNGVLWTQGQEPIHIENSKGVDNLLNSKYISTQLKTPSGLTHLGIVIDADDDPDNRWISLRNACLPSIPDLPRELPTQGLIHQLETGIKFGVWMMPDNRSRGMLETFLAYLITREDDTLWLYSQEAVGEAKNRGATYKDTHLDKAKIHTWLAWQNPPGQQLHIAVRSKVLQPDNPQSQEFVQWFKKLYEV